MRLIDKVSILVTLIAGGLVYLAEYYHLRFLIPIAIGIFGLFGIWLGVDTFIHGEIRLYDRLYSRREHYSGISAQLMAIIFFLFGAGVTLYAIWEWVQPAAAGAFLAELVDSNRGWGFILITVGFFSLLFGLVRLIVGSAHSSAERNIIADIGFRTGGLISTVFGIIIFVIGSWLMFR